MGNAATQTTALGTTTTVYDRDNQVQSVADPQSHTTSTVYDADDNVMQQIDALNNTTTLVYNALNQQVATIDPLSNTTTAIYDGAGQQVGSRWTSFPLAFCHRRMVPSSEPEAISWPSGEKRMVHTSWVWPCSA